MSDRLPIRSIVRVNAVLALLLPTIFCIFLVAITEDLTDSVLRFFQLLVFVALTSTANVLLQITFSHRKWDSRSLGRIYFYLISYCSAVGVWLLVKYLYTAITAQPWEGEGPHMIQSYSLAVLAVSAFNTLILMLQHLVVLQHRKAKSEFENLQLKTAAAETRNLLLTQQIHPHFLFNALNTVKSLYKKDIGQGEQYLVHLANFLRVSVSNHSTTTTLIRNELDFCMNYLNMQQVRFGSALEFSVKLSQVTINKGFLPFFSLQPLVENALKHNYLTEEAPVRIVIDEDRGYIRVTNNVQPMSYKEPSAGHGLSNLIERYRILDGEAVKIEANSEIFRVSIKILGK